jgi:hypothetical protein
MRRRSLYPAVLALAALTLVACGGEGNGAGPGTTTVTKIFGEEGDQTTTTVEVPITPTRHLTSFQMPSHNIGCYMSGQFGGNARCDIRKRSWTPPPKPASCELDWGQGVAFHGKHKAGVVCAGDTTLDKTAPVLPYGQASKVGPIVCKSTEQEVTCNSLNSQHGFALSRESYRVG